MLGFFLYSWSGLSEPQMTCCVSELALCVNWDSTLFLPTAWAQAHITTLPWASQWVTRLGPGKPPVLMPFPWQNTAAKNVTGFPDQCYKMVTHLSFLSPRLPASIVSSSGCQSCIVAWFPAVLWNWGRRDVTLQGPSFPLWIPQTLQALRFAVTYCLSCRL